MTDTDAGRFRAEAEECRKFAASARAAIDKAAWIKLAGDWDRLAEGAITLQDLPADTGLDL